jgi:hypothetical protein
MNSSINDARLNTSSTSGGARSAILRAITQAISRLLEVVHRLVDVVVRAAGVDPAAIDRLIETGTESSNARVQAAHQALLIADAIGLLLCCCDHTDTREREYSRQSDNMGSFGHDSPASIQSKKQLRITQRNRIRPRSDASVQNRASQAGRWTARD